MKCLTVLNPWAWAMFKPDNPKDIENREWKTSHRGPLLIHAGLKPCTPGEGVPDGTPVPAGLVYGAILGAVDVVDCVPVTSKLVRGNVWAEGSFCFILANPRRLAKPVPCKGKLGFWQMPDPVAAAVMAQLA